MDKKRQTVQLREEAFNLLIKYVAEHGNTKENIVRRAVLDLVTGQRAQFLKMYAPHLTLEYSTPNAIFVNDHELNKTAVVKINWNNISEKPKTGIIYLKNQKLE